MAGHVVREKDIRARGEPPDGFTESYIRSVLEREGIDFGRTCHCRGISPNREWTNARELFMPTDEEMAAQVAEAAAATAQSAAAEQRAVAEKAAMQKRIDELEAQVALQDKVGGVL